MSFCPYLSQAHWPCSRISDTLFQYFLDTKYCTKHGDFDYFKGRKAFVDAINSVPDFVEFWVNVQEQHPTKKDYFLSLLDERKQYFSHWISNEYGKYLQAKAFEELSDVDKKNLQDEFDDLKPAAYRAALKGEALRLKCDISEVRPTSVVLPWTPYNDEESPLAKLSDEIFARVFQLLDALDIFRMTLVSRKWKSLIHNNAQHLKRAEHAATTHTTTFTDWMDPAYTPDRDTFLSQHRSFSWCLAKWYCEISENLETLILDHQVPHGYLALLLKSCPNLKHLRIGYDADLEDSTPDTILTRVELRKLEVFMHHPLHIMDDSVGSCRQLQSDILVSSSSLRVFKGGLDSEDLYAMDSRKPINNIFSKLTALDLDRFKASGIEILAKLDHLQLKYLRLGYLFYDSEADWIIEKERSRNALHQLLPKLDRLKILITSLNVGITNDTFQLLIDLKLNLDVALFYDSYVSASIVGETGNPTVEMDPLQPEILIAFQEMLVSRNPYIDLSKIHLLSADDGTLAHLETLGTGFTFMELFDYSFGAKPKIDLNDPHVKHLVGIEF